MAIRQKLAMTLENKLKLKKLKKNAFNKNLQFLKKYEKDWYCPKKSITVLTLIYKVQGNEVSVFLAFIYA